MQQAYCVYRTFCRDPAICENWVQTGSAEHRATYNVQCMSGLSILQALLGQASPTKPFSSVVRGMNERERLKGVKNGEGGGGRCAWSSVTHSHTLFEHYNSW